tara:strand:+ start:327 stop:509 length:183 start_codon:yes stop_codon:yes gene_type:complete
MFIRVEKIYSPINNEFVYYKCDLSNGRKMAIANNPDSPEYEQVQEWIADGGTVIDNGGEE